MDDYRRINKVATEYKKIVDRRHEGMWHLVKSLEFTCKWHKKYVDDALPVYHDEYKPGSLVFVDFGLNVGSEFSKPHFAIVLNKSDNKRSANLTVIPLTSKKSAHVLGINDSIFNNTIQHLDENLETLKISVDKYKEDLKEIDKKITKTANDLNVESEGKTTITLCMDLISKSKDSEAETRQVVIDHAEDLLQSIGRLNAKLREQKECMKLTEIVRTQYKKYDKKSFVVYKSIQTVSKLRVKKINRFDPSGSIQISKATFDEIKNVTLNYIF